MSKPSRFIFASFFALLLTIVFFKGTAAMPTGFMIYHVHFLYFVFAGLGFAALGYHVYGLTGRYGLLLFTYLLCTLVLIGVSFQQMGTGFPNPGRVAKLLLIALLFLGFVTACPDQYAFLRAAGVYIAAFAVLFGIYLTHALPLAAGSGGASFPIAAGFMMGLNLFVVPRYVSRNTFLWIVSVLSALVVLIGLPAYSIGNYTFLGMDVQLFGGSFTPLFFKGRVNSLQSVFANPNTLGAVAFAGTVASITLAHQLFPGTDIGHNRKPVRADGAPADVLSYPYTLSLGLSFLAGVLFVINVLGAYLSNSRASMLAVAVSLALYFSYASLGRRALPYAGVALTFGVGLFLVAFPVLGISASGRFVLWGSSVRAFLANPSLIGAGMVDPGAYIADYVVQQYKGTSPHNSYLTILLRTGLLGLAAYLFIVVGSLVQGLIRYDRVDVPALALAFGFAAHQLFEAYGLYQFSVPAVLASLAFGYLILDSFRSSLTESEARSRNPASTNRPWSNRPKWNG